MPAAISASSCVKRRRKPGMMAMLTTIITTPCTRLSTKAVGGGRSRPFSRSPAPRYSAIMALMPTPKPMAMALEKFWMGNTRLNAVMASSLMRATNRLSTMLYRLFTSMEISPSFMEISTAIRSGNMAGTGIGLQPVSKMATAKSHTMAL